MRIAVFSKWIHRTVGKENLEQIQLWEIVPAVMVSLLITWIAFYAIPLNQKNPVDIYAVLAHKPFHFRELPYGARLLTPLLVHWLPVDINQGFRIVAFISYWLSGIFLYGILRLVGTQVYIALALLPGFYFAPAARTIIANAWYIDPMSYWLLLLTFFAGLTGNFGLTTAAVTLGAFNRPESLAVIPIIGIAWWRKDYPVRSLIPTAASALPGAAIYSVIYFIWPLVSDYQVFVKLSGAPLITNPQDTMSIFREHGFRILISTQVLREILPYLWGAAVLGFLRLPRRITVLAIVHIILSILPMLIANDFFRLPFFAFPAVFLAAGMGFTYLYRIHSGMLIFFLLLFWIQLAAAPFALLPGVVIGILFQLGYWLIPIPTESALKTPSEPTNN